MTVRIKYTHNHVIPALWVDLKAKGFHSNNGKEVVDGYQQYHDTAVGQDSVHPC